MSKLNHLEGLRGVSAFIVFLAHFRTTFCYNINEKILDNVGVLEIKQRLIWDNFLQLIYEGTLPVFIFWFMSAYVISIKLFDVNINANNKYLMEASTKRYFRFLIPVFFSSLLCFILMKLNFIYNNELAGQLGHGYRDGWLSLWYNFNPNLLNFLKTTLVEVFFTGNSNYNNALWTMTPELMGSLLCFGIFGIAGRNKYRFGIYLFILFFLVIAGLRDNNFFVYLVFLAGVMWSDCSYSTDTNIPFRDGLKILFNSKLFALSLLIISFGTTIFSDIFLKLPENLIFLLGFPFKAIGITLLINNSSVARSIFSIRPLRFMGRISFSFYLLHIPLLFSIGIYLYLYAGIDSPYKLMIVFIASTVISIIISYFFTKLVDKKAIQISNKIGKFFSN